MARRTKSSGDDGGPAPKIGLALATDGLRCQRIRGNGERCSRFGIWLPGGERDAFCIAHSASEYAAQVRRRGVVARQVADEAELERRRQLADEIAPEPLQTPYDVTFARTALLRSVINRDLTPAEVREARAILDACEAQMLIAPGEWKVPTI